MKKIEDVRQELTAMVLSTTEMQFVKGGATTTTADDKRRTRPGGGTTTTSPAKIKG